MKDYDRFYIDGAWQAQGCGAAADLQSVSISSITGNVSSQDLAVLVMKKQQDAEKTLAQGLLTLIKNAPGPSGDIGNRINVYA